MIALSSNDFDTFLDLHHSRCLGDFEEVREGNTVILTFVEPSEEAIIADDLVVEHVTFERE